MVYKYRIMLSIRFVGLFYRDISVSCSLKIEIRPFLLLLFAFLPLSPFILHATYMYIELVTVEITINLSFMFPVSVIVNFCSALFRKRVKSSGVYCLHFILLLFCCFLSATPSPLHPHTSTHTHRTYLIVCFCVSYDLVEFVCAFHIRLFCVINFLTKC